MELNDTFHLLYPGASYPRQETFVSTIVSVERKNAVYLDLLRDYARQNANFDLQLVDSNEKKDT